MGLPIQISRINCQPAMRAFEQALEALQSIALAIYQDALVDDFNCLRVRVCKVVVLFDCPEFAGVGKQGKLMDCEVKVNFLVLKH